MTGELAADGNRIINDPERRIVNIVDLAKELERRKETAVDMVVHSENLAIEPAGKNVMMAIDTDAGHEVFGINDWAHQQLAQKTQIPQRYYNRMREEGEAELLARNVNTWLPDKDRRLIRVLDNDVRAVLSDRYRTLDNYDLTFQAMEVFNGIPGIEIKTAELSDRHMYVKAIKQDFTYEVKDHDEVQMGILMSNSEVGDGAFSVSPFMWRLACTNGMIAETTMRQIHLGSRREIGIFTEETLKADDGATWLKVRDTIQAAFSEDIFIEWVEEVRRGTGIEIAQPTEVVDNVIASFTMTEAHKNELLNAFMGEEQTLWGLANSVTRIAKNESTPEDQVELERIGSTIATLKGRPLEQLLTVTG